MNFEIRENNGKRCADTEGGYLFWVSLANGGHKKALNAHPSVATWVWGDERI
jgi:hypothetical protein